MQSNSSELESAEMTDEEFYDEFIKPTVERKDKPNKKLTQRIGIRELYSLVAKESRYSAAEVEDVINAFWNVINVQLENGREFNFGGMFTARMYKPIGRRLYDPRQGGFRITDPRPRLKLVPTDEYKRYLHRGIHCPVNYFKPQTVRSQYQSPEEFTKEFTEAYDKWYTEDQRRQAKKLAEQSEKDNKCD